MLFFAIINLISKCINSVNYIDLIIGFEKTLIIDNQNFLTNKNYVFRKLKIKTLASVFYSLRNFSKKK